MRRYSRNKDGKSSAQVIRDDFDLIKLIRSGGEFGSLVSSGGKVATASCIHCPDSPCVHLSDEEIQSETDVKVTHNPNDSICTFDAIEWLQEDQSPQINTSRCVGCGACIGRCPVGAIRANRRGKAALREKEAPGEVFKGSDSIKVEEFRRHLEQIKSRTAVSLTQNEVQRTIHNFESVLEGLRENPGHGSVESLLARNLLSAIGFTAKAGNPGDVNSRLDLIFTLADDKTGLVEIETNTEKLLNSPRRLLTSYASIRRRQDIPPEKLEVFAFWAKFPNARQDVFEVIENIRSRVGLKIRTVPLCLLYLLAIHGYQPGDIDLTNGFLISRDKKSVLEDSFRQLGVTPPADTHNYFGPKK